MGSRECTYPFFNGMRLPFIFPNYLPHPAQVAAAMFAMSNPPPPPMHLPLPPPPPQQQQQQSLATTSSPKRPCKKTCPV